MRKRIILVLKINYKKMKNKKSKIFICPHCRKEQGGFGVVRQETHFYSVSIETSQWEDEGEDSDLDSEKYYCLSCEKQIDYALVEPLR